LTAGAMSDDLAETLTNRTVLIRGVDGRRIRRSVAAVHHGDGEVVFDVEDEEISDAPPEDSSEPSRGDRTAHRPLDTFTGVANIVAVAVFLLPTCTMFQKESRQSGIAAKDCEIERGRIPVAATHRDRPTELDHEPRPLVAALRREIRQQPQPCLRERAGQVGRPKRMRRASVSSPHAQAAMNCSSSEIGVAPPFSRRSSATSPSPSCKARLYALAPLCVDAEGSAPAFRSAATCRRDRRRLMAQSNGKPHSVSRE
jgi:hypothetical protein